jgi:hypothetical protein
LAGAVERVASFRYVGLGHVTAADALLAASAAARAREGRRLAREARCSAPAKTSTTDRASAVAERCPDAGEQREVAA